MAMLDGKVAIITGGAKGQGRAEAQLFVDNGARVVITDLDEDNGRAAAETIGPDCLFVPHDVASAESWAEVVARTSEHFGGIDILINNAGIWASGTVTDIALDELKRIYDVNVFGAFLGMQSVVPAMQSRGGGAIINISSIGGMRAFGGTFGYGTSKWALRGMSRYAAAELAEHGIRVNAIMSGMVATDLVLRPDAQAMQEKALATVPMGRRGTVSEVAGIALFLVSDAASYMTGAEIVADGGQIA